MKYMNKITYKQKVVAMVLAFAMVMAIAMSHFGTLISRAESAASVTASTANVRQEPNSSSSVLGSVVKDDKISIIGQTVGADGKTWYQIYVNAGTLGYIRSDLVTITDGSTPATIQAESTAAPTEETPAAGVSTDGIRQVNPVEATVSGGQSVRVRSDASTSTDIVTTAQNGLAVTVSGVKTAADGKDWYYVTFADGGNTVSGYIRSDFVTLSGELTDVVAEEPVAPEADPEVGPAPEDETTVEVKAYELQERDGVWYLIDTFGKVEYDIKDMFEKVQDNYTLYAVQEKKAKTYKRFCIILVILFIAAIAALGFLVLKLGDVETNRAFKDAENNRKSRPAESLKDRIMKPSKNGTVGTAGKPMNQGQRRPADGQRRPADGQRRPVDGQRRPADGQRRPAGQGMPGNGQPRQGMPGNGQPRQGMSGNGQPRQGMPGNGQPRQGVPGNGQPRQGMPGNGQPRQNMPGNAPAPGSAPMPGSPMGTPSGAPNGNPANGGPRPAADSAPKNPMKSRFVEDDDEFEYRFTNWDEDDK